MKASKIVKQDRIEKAMMQIYREVYAASTPPADFDLLVEESPLNERGQRIIPYDQYEIDQKLFEDIMEEVLKKLKTSKYIKDGIRRSILLGCSPKFKRITT